MKIATRNINECVGITTNLDNQETIDIINTKNIEEIITKINEYDFDIVCFQEYPTYINKNISLTQELSDKTNLKYHIEHDTYDSFLFNDGKVWISIFSKYKIRNSHKTLFINPNITKKSLNGEIYHSYNKWIIKIEIELDDENYTIISGHAIAFAPFGKNEFDYPESYKPLEDLIKENTDKNLIVLGDFNTENLFEVIPDINDKVHDIIKQPTTKSYYENRGEKQMDYILINDKLEESNIYKIDNFSDHYLIGAEISKKKEYLI